MAACTEAPCLQVNYRYRYRVTHADFDALLDDLRRRSPRRRDPAARHRWPGCASTSPPTASWAPVAPRTSTGPPAWIARAEEPAS